MTIFSTRLTVALAFTVLLVASAPPPGAANTGATDSTLRLCTRLKSPSEEIRYTALVAAAQVSPANARPLIPGLIKNVNDPSSRVQIAAIEALGHIGPGAAEAVPTLVKILAQALPSGANGQWQAASNSSIGAAMPTIRALGQIGPASRAATLIMADCLLNNSFLNERLAILTALQSIGPDPSCAHAILVVARQEGKGTQTRTLALRALSSIRPVPSEAVPFLQELSTDAQDTRSQAEARKLLKVAASHGTSSVAKHTSIVTLRHQLASDDTMECGQALSELSESKSLAVQLIPSLVRLATGKQTAARSKALEILGNLGLDAAAASPALVECGLREQDPHARLSVLHAVQMIDPEGTTSVVTAAASLDDPFKAPNAIQLLEMYGDTRHSRAVEAAKKRWRLR